MDTTPSEDNVLDVINHARPVSTTHFNVPHAPIITSVPMGDVFQLALLTNISTPSQKAAGHALEPVPLAVQNNTVSPVQTPRSSQLEVNVCRAFTHAPLVVMTCHHANHAKADSPCQTVTVSELAQAEPDQSTESAHADQESSWMEPVLLHAQLDTPKSDKPANDAIHHVLNALAQPLSVLTAWILTY